jgi:predicted nucleic acid-binding protein
MRDHDLDGEPEVERLVDLLGDLRGRAEQGERTGRGVIEEADAMAHARRQLSRVDQIALDADLLDAAATLAPGIALRPLDAVHLAAARAVGADLRAVITYDPQMQAAAVAVGIPVDAPA